MTTLELRRKAKNTIDELSSDRLKFVNEFLDYVKENGPRDATSELPRIPGFIESLRRGEKDFRNGRATNWRKVRRDV